MGKCFLIRTCVGCSQQYPKEQLIRVARLPDKSIAVDDLEKKPKQLGRGAYLCKNLKCLERAQKRKPKNALSFSLKNPVAENVFESLKTMM